MSPLTTKSRLVNWIIRVHLLFSFLLSLPPSSPSLVSSSLSSLSPSLPLSGSNVCTICEEHQLLAVGTEEGVVECYDPRSNTSVGILDVCSDRWVWS